MYPRPFEYERAGSVEEAIALIVSYKGEARLIAGGQSLVPMMSMGLATPDRVVDISRLELAGLKRRNGAAVLGGLTRHRELERSGELAATLPLAAEAARFIGNPRVRNRGTLGGSLAHADPAAELGAVALVYGGRAILQGPDDERSVPFDEFFHGYFATAIGPGEVLTRIELDLPPPGSGHGFWEVANRADDFATAAATTIVTLGEDGGTCAGARIALAGVADTPLRVPRAEELCRGEAGAETLFERVAEVVREAVEPEEDPFVSAAYRRRAAGVCARRAVAAAFARARRGESA